MLEIAAEEYTARLFSIPYTTNTSIEKLKLAISEYYKILDAHHNTTSALYSHAVDLEPRDRRILDNVEVDVTNLFKAILEEGVAKGEFDELDSFVLAYNIVSLGHMWALKRNRFRGYLNVDGYIETQTRFVLTILNPRSISTKSGKPSEPAGGRKRAPVAAKTRAEVGGLAPLRSETAARRTKVGDKSNQTTNTKGRT